MSNLKIKVPTQDNCAAHTITANSVALIAEDGREMFEVRVIDGKTIEVSSIMTCKVNQIVHDTRIVVLPKGSESIRITVLPYES